MSRRVGVGMDSDRVRTVRIPEFGYKCEYYQMQIQNKYFEFRFTIKYLLDL
jgi:hypothetical protein